VTGLPGFDADGFAIVPDAVSVEGVAALVEEISRELGGSAGMRGLLARPWSAELARELRAGRVLDGMIDKRAVAVQCTYFAKGARGGWLVPIHQDRTIPVEARIDEPRLSGWSIKEGVSFVNAPPEVLDAMVAVRVHLDPCGPDDGPLFVVPGSHQLGVIDPGAASRMREAEVACLASAGTAVLMRPLLLHRSSKPTGTSARRVLHYVYGPAELPFGLRWRLAV
jgi:hypothetical protein